MPKDTFEPAEPSANPPRVNRWVLVLGLSVCLVSLLSLCGAYFFIRGYDTPSYIGGKPLPLLLFQPGVVVFDTFVGAFGVYTAGVLTILLGLMGIHISTRPWEQPHRRSWLGVRALATLLCCVLLATSGATLASIQNTSPVIGGGIIGYVTASTVNDWLESLPLLYALTHGAIVIAAVLCFCVASGLRLWWLAAPVTLGVWAATTVRERRQARADTQGLSEFVSQEMEGTSPDVPLPDSALPDSALPDSAFPDSAMPELHQETEPPLGTPPPAEGTHTPQEHLPAAPLAFAQDHDHDHDSDSGSDTAPDHGSNHDPQAYPDLTKEPIGIEAAEFVLPQADLLKADHHSEDIAPPSREALATQARQIEKIMRDFGVNGKIVRARPGPVVTLFEFEPAPGVKNSKVINIADDLARAIGALSVRIATIPGLSVLGIEISNPSRQSVAFTELITSAAFRDTNAKLPLVLGKDLGGSAVVADLATMPHLLIAGTTGSGKSVGVNAMILSLLFTYTPEQCRLILIDPKRLEFSSYQDIPYLLTPVLTEPQKALAALKWAVAEMESRYEKMAAINVRNLDSYNAKAEQALPFVVIVVDEMADLMLVAGKDIEVLIQRLAQMARAAGIHLVMATQRPSVDVITGTIKANFPTRISYQVSSTVDSRTILGESGAETLLGKGDMLFMQAGGKISRVHGPFVSDDDVNAVAEFLCAQMPPDYIAHITAETASEQIDVIYDGSDGDDQLYEEAKIIVARDQKASVSYLQRRLQIGYNRAARLIEQMEREGLVSAATATGKREIFLDTL